MLQISFSNLYKIFRDFHTLTNIKLVLFDKDVQPLLSYPPKNTDFCELICSSPEWSAKCNECDRANCGTCEKTKNVVFYRCHLGLMEAIVPIFDQNGVFGYVMFGQVLMKETCEQTKNNLKKQFSEQEFPGITQAIDNIPIKSGAELNASVTILQALVTHLVTNQWVKPERSEFIRHMDKFIEANLTQNITVNDICAEFNIRRTSLYDVASEYLGCSIAKYIRKQRIYHACEMIRNTDMSITDIAYAVGFSDYGHFSRVFHQIQGMSASAYRHKSSK